MPRESDTTTARESSADLRYQLHLGVLLLILLSAIVLLLWQNQVHERETQAQQLERLKVSVDGAAQEIQLQLKELKRALRLFVTGHRQAIRFLAEHPDDQAAYDRLAGELRSVFPEYFAFTLATAEGRLIVDDFDGFVEAICQADIKYFARTGRPPDLVIHPNPLGYHFDMMVPYTSGRNGNNIFFVSFRPALLTRFLANRRIPDYRLMLLHRGLNGLIEVTDTGSRDTLSRDFRLSKTELDGVQYFVPLEGTLWKLVVLPDRTAVDGLSPHKWNPIAWAVLFLLAIGAVALWQLRRSQEKILSQRRTLERQAQALRREDERMRRLQETTSARELTFDEKMKRLLKLGLEQFDLEIGILARVENDQYTVLHSVAPEGTVKDGDSFPLGDTYCRHTLEVGGPAATAHAAESEWKGHPCYKLFQLEAYIGSPVYVHGQVYGTLNFSSSNQRQQEFSAGDLEFVQIMARWAGVELERRQYMRELLSNQRLLAAISRAQSHYIAEVDAHTLFDGLLEDILRLTESEYGFIGEIEQQDDGAPCIRTHAISNIAWNEESRRRYEESKSKGIVFANLNTLYGAVVTSGKTVIANDAMNDSRCGGLPQGHPELDTFLGVPLYSGSKLVGIVAVANRRQGYEARMVESLQPLFKTCAHIIDAYTATHQRQQAVQELDRFFSLSLDMLCIAGFDGYFKRINPAWETTLGYSREELLSRPFIDFVHPADRKATLAEAERLMEGGLTIAFECRFRHRNGNYLWFSWVAVADMERRLLYAVTHDVTETKRSDQLLRETTAMQAAILDSANFSIISTDPGGVIQTFNAGAERLLGYKSGEVVGKLTPLIIHDEEEIKQRAKELSLELNRPIDPGFEVFVTKARHNIADEREWTYIRKDGTRFTVLLSVTAVRDEDGRITGFLGIGSDITERKKIERMKNEFISTVSHELRTPLTSIQGSLGLLSGGAAGKLTAQAQSLLSIARKNSDRLLLLINDILDVEKIESGKMEFDFADIELMPFLEQAVAANETFGKAYRVRFRITGGVNRVHVRADTNRLMQVMNNLLANAAKFAPEDSTVEITAEQYEDKVRVSVTDRGPGIPEEFRSRIFDRFTQADASDTRKAGGTGLGLNISRAIVERHHGRIDFISRPGRGATFFFELPLQPAVTKAKADAEPGPGGESRLFVEGGREG